MAVVDDEVGHRVAHRVGIMFPEACSTPVAIAFDKPGARRLAHRLEGFDSLLSTSLLEAELHATLKREPVDAAAEDLLSWLSWIFPNRPLTPEFLRISATGYVRGADLWHLATALYVMPVPSGMSFLTLDARQSQVASRLGFPV